MGKSLQCLNGICCHSHSDVALDLLLGMGLGPLFAFHIFIAGTDADDNRKTNEFPKNFVENLSFVVMINGRIVVKCVGLQRWLQ